MKDIHLNKKRKFYKNMDALYAGRLEIEGYCKGIAEKNLDVLPDIKDTNISTHKISI